MSRDMVSLVSASDTEGEASVELLTIVEAVNLAMRRAMIDDDNVVVLGEDVAVNGGVFRATDGLRDQFGLKRVMDTPLAETMIAGMSVGMAAQGLRPIAEIQFMGFIYAAMEQIIGHASRLRNRTRGRLNCPLVVRAPFGGGIHAPEHHCESTEALFAHIPGIRVVAASSPRRAYGLLLSSIRNNDPVLFLEPKRLYRMNKSELLDDGKGLPLDQCFKLRTGGDISLVSWGAMIHETMQAAEKLATIGIQAEVIDVATLSPIDHQSIIKSVKKTGNCIVIQEAAPSCSIGSEIAATVSEAAFPYLKNPVSRVSGFDTVMPYFKNEHYYIPDVGQIIDIAIEMCRTEKD